MSDANQSSTDVVSNRKAKKWTRKELLGRVLWAVATPLFRYSPRPLWAWRRWVLALFGARIGPNVHIYPSVRITIPWNIRIEASAAIGDRVILYALGPIRIGTRTTISQGAHLCAGTHDWRDPTMPLVKAPISIGDEAWICADAFVGPGITIGKRAILGARAVAMRSLADDVIAVGNPASVISHRSQEYSHD